MSGWLHIVKFPGIWSEECTVTEYVIFHQGNLLHTVLHRRQVMQDLQRGFVYGLWVGILL